jgi:hypothetical protein
MDIIMRAQDIPADLLEFFEPVEPNAARDWQFWPTTGGVGGLQHYAAFPLGLPSLAIRAGTSERGVCPKCQAPWARVVEREKHPTRDVEAQRTIDAASPGRVDGHVSGPQGMIDAARTSGWRPTCRCVAGICSTCAVVLKWTHDKETPSTREDVSELPSSVSSLEEPAGVLPAGVLRSGAKTCTPNQELPEVRCNVSDTALPSSHAVLQQEMRDHLDCAASGEQSRLVQRPEGVHPGLSANASIRDEGGLRDAAPTGHGGTPGSLSAPRRSCPPQESSEGRQPTGELRSDGQAGARRDENAQVHGDVSMLRSHVPDQRTCPYCRGAVVVAPLQPVPATVLDCFVGSGTTLIAADRLGRSAIGIDVQPTYIDLAAGRARRDAPLFATVEVERQAEAAAKQRDLFSVLDEMQGTQEAAGE